MNKKKFQFHSIIALVLFVLLFLGFKFLNVKYVDILWIITIMCTLYILTVAILRFLYQRKHKNNE